MSQTISDTMYDILKIRNNSLYSAVTKQLVDATRKNDRTAYKKALQRAADYGFLFNDRGEQIWEVPKDGNEYLMLHWDDDTTAVGRDLRGEGFMPKLEEDVEFSFTEPPAPVEPQLDLFWTIMNGLCRFFTIGFLGLPSVNKYEDDKKRYDKQMKHYRDHQTIREKEEAVEEESDEPEELNQSGNKPLTAEDQRNVYHQKLINSIQWYGKNHQETLFSAIILCAALDSLKKKDAPEYNHVFNLMTRYFVQKDSQADPEAMLSGMGTVMSEEVYRSNSEVIEEMLVELCSKGTSPIENLNKINTKVKSTGDEFILG